MLDQRITFQILDESLNERIFKKLPAIFLFHMFIIYHRSFAIKSISYFQNFLHNVSSFILGSVYIASAKLASLEGNIFTLQENGSFKCKKILAIWQLKIFYSGQNLLNFLGKARFFLESKNVYCLLCLKRHLEKYRADWQKGSVSLSGILTHIEGILSLFDLFFLLNFYVIFFLCSVLVGE